MATVKKKSATARAPRPRQADVTRQRILQAAIKEFAAEGYSGARVDAICKRARSNPRMIYHYFGDKDGLYATRTGCTRRCSKTGRAAALSTP